MKLRPERRHKLTPEALERIFAARAQGGTWEAACAAEGVSSAALRRLAMRDPDVRERMEIANGAGARWYAERIQTCEAGKDAADDWRRWAWLAERFHPTVFRRPTERLDVSVKPPEQMDRAEIYAELVLAGTLTRGANPDDEAEAVRRGLLPPPDDDCDDGDEV